jgi:hypothetical protein
MVRQACPELDEGLSSRAAWLFMLRLCAGGTLSTNGWLLRFAPFAQILRLRPLAQILRLRPPFALSLSKGERLDAQHNGLSKGERLDAQHDGLSSGEPSFCSHIQSVRLTSAWHSHLLRGE